MHKRAIPNEHVLMRHLAVSLASSDALKVAFMRDFSSQKELSIFLEGFSLYFHFLCGITKAEHAEVGRVY